MGPHRDEVELWINETPARHYGSQGQQRTVVLAIKVAELELLATVIGEPPVPDDEAEDRRRIVP